MKTVEERFFEKVNITDSCWIWIGTPNRDGYGRMSVNKKQYLAHRLSYQIHKGEISNDLCVCHTCDNPSCVNPEHLWIGTHQNNVTDKVNKNRHAKGKMLPNGSKTHCIYGHEFNEENTYLFNGKRACRICRKRIDKAYYVKKKVQNAKQKN
jgi:hypothetical protein